MAKGYNPADAHRKAQKAKEKKRNKEQRKTANELRDVKKGTGSIENEIKELSAKERSGALNAAEKTALESARAELIRVRKAKEEYVKAHPEARDQVLGAPRQRLNDADEGDLYTPGGFRISFKQRQDAERQGLQFDKKGRLLNPEKSLYYDAVFNPFGAPPPGLPYKAKPPTPEELAAMESSSDSDEDDIVMPEGPRPDGSEESSSEESEDSDDIPMPEGPPPPKSNPSAALTHPPLPMPPYTSLAPLPPRPHFSPNTQIPTAPRAHISQPPLVNNMALPMRPHSIPSHPPLPPPSSLNHPLPVKPGTMSALPQPPPLDPAKLAAAKASATISAAPQVRDLKKEAVAFVPQALKRKRPAASTSANASRKVAVVGSDALSTSSEPVSQDLRNVARSMALPPGFGGSTVSRQVLGPSVTVSNDDEGAVYSDDDGPVQTMALPPGFGPPNGQQYTETDAHHDMPSVALPPGFDKYKRHSSFTDDIEDEDESLGDEQGVSMLPPMHTYNSLPGFDEVEDDVDLGEEQGVALPPSGMYGSLPGMDDSDEEQEGVEQGVALPPEYARLDTTVEED